ncbi:MAG: hypothetical protein OJF61_002110 [Rhodanobacteraceae bacterium]|jgi:hypothetical protein|nr:MAG: hypothetical protein OJF61_002110 [Rhodanobacteraceae bacterium]
MKRKNLALSAVLACTALGVGIAGARDFKSAAPMDQLSEFVGNGVCTGSVMAMGKTPSHASTGKYHSEKTLDGHWIVIHYDEDSGAGVAKPYHVIQYISYDPTKQRFVSVAFDNSSPGYSVGSGTGWKQGDAFTLDETQVMGGKPVVFRDTFTRSGSNVSTHIGTMRDEHGKWVKTDEEDCKPL